MKINLKSKRVHLSVIIIVSFLVYANIFQNSFVWDDFDFIVNWEETRSFENLPSILKGAAPATDFGGVYRPLRGVFYMISYKLWGQNPVGYHAQAILVHLICTILIYLIISKITEKKTIAFMASLLFGIHPIHVEAITFITTSLDIIGVIFFFASFYLYLKAQKENKKNLYFAVIFFALLAFFTYEITLILPVVIILHDLCFNKSKIKENIPKYAPLFVGALFYVFVRFFIFSISGRGGYLAGSFYITMLTMTKVFAKYLLLLLFPMNLNVNHHISRGVSSYLDYNDAALLEQSLFDFDILASILLIATLIFIAVKSFKKYPIVSFCIGWIFIGLSPVSYVVPLAVIMAEKYAYIASFGYCLLFSFLIFSIYHKVPKGKKYLQSSIILFFIVTALFYAGLTGSRNNDWKDPLTLWDKTAEQNPYSSQAHNNLGVWYRQNGETGSAIREFQKVIEINPKHARAHYNLGLIYMEQGKFDLAVAEFETAIKIEPDYTKAVEWLSKAYTEKGNYYKEQGEVELAIENYKKAADINPAPEAYFALAVAYTELNEIELAVDMYRKVLSIDPDSFEAQYNLVVTYYAKGDMPQAIEEYKKLESINPDDPSLKNLKDALGID